MVIKTQEGGKNKIDLRHVACDHSASFCQSTLPVPLLNLTSFYLLLNEKGRCSMNMLALTFLFFSCNPTDAVCQ